MKTVVLYTSTSGFTARYARWIAEELDCPCRSLSEAPDDVLQGCDTVVYGGSLHAVGIAGYRRLKKRFGNLEGHEVFVFATGASPGRDHIPDEVMNANFTDEEKSRFHFYYFRGGFDFSKLNAVNRFIMNLMRWKIRLTPPAKRSPDEKGMWEAFRSPVDFTKKERIAPLIMEITKGSD